MIKKKGEVKEKTVKTIVKSFYKTHDLVLVNIRGCKYGISLDNIKAIVDNYSDIIAVFELNKAEIALLEDGDTCVPEQI